MLAPTYSNALERYFIWESESLVEVISDFEQADKAEFLPLDAVRSYFTSYDNRQQRRNLDQILSAIFGMDFPPIDSDLIIRHHTAIFCILLSIGRGKYIKSFISSEELSDQLLPVDSAHPPRRFPTLKGDPGFLKEFCDIQWKYCVPILDSHMYHRHFENHRYLPITFKRQLRSHGSAKSHIVEVYGPYNKIIRELDKTKNPYINNFLIKSYSNPEELPVYAREVNAFRSVKDYDGIIKYYGCFQYGKKSHILLEYADKGTLMDFLRNEAPPTREAEIIDFWENLLHLSKGLRAIHSIKQSHNNICPEKILVLSNGAKSPSSWKFKFSKISTTLQGPISSEKLAQAHVPPERQPDCQKTKLEANTDIWCLGYVYSQAAMWVADGYRGILDFQKQQLADIDELKANKCFYGDGRVSETIIDAHSEVEDHLRRSDYITKDILANIVDEMLCNDNRPNAETLAHRADMIISTARQKLAEVSSVKKLSRRRSQSRNNLWASSVHPPLPQVVNEQKYETSPAVCSLPQHVESWRINVMTNSAPTSVCGSTSSVAESGSSIVLNTHFFGRSTGKNTPDIENSTPITSWFLDSPKGESPVTPHTLITTGVNQYDSHFPESNNQPNFELPPEANKLLKQSLITKSHDELHLNRIMDRGEDTTDPESRTKLTEEVSLPGALQTLPSQGSSFKYRLPPLLPRRSYLRNTEQVKESVTRSLSTVSSPTSDYKCFPSLGHSIHQSGSMDFKIQSHQNAGTESRSQATIEPLKSQNNKSQHKWTLFKESASIAPSETLEITSERGHKYKPVSDEVLALSYSPSIRSKSARSGIGSNILSRSRRLSSALSSRQNSLLSMHDHNSLVTKVAPAHAKNLEPAENNINLNKIPFLDINACLCRKHSTKKIKKKNRVSDLPGAYLLQPLSRRDHVFIVDDSISMAPHWSNVCLVFEGLSNVVKGLSPLGTELHYTNSEDTRRCKSNHELCQFISEKRLQRVQTNIAKRLDLQLSAYRLKLSNSKKKGVKDVRPMNIYILTNGLWTTESETSLRESLEQTTSLLKQLSLKDQISVSFIGFVKGVPAAGRMEALSNLNWGDGLNVRWSIWTTNVWQMLRPDIIDINLKESVSEISSEPSKFVGHKIGRHSIAASRFPESRSKKLSVSSEIEGLFELA